MFQTFEVCQNAPTNHSNLYSPCISCFCLHTSLIFLKPGLHIFFLQHHDPGKDECGHAPPLTAGFVQKMKASLVPENLSVIIVDFDAWFERLRSRKSLQKQR